MIQQHQIDLRIFNYEQYCSLGWDISLMVVCPEREFGSGLYGECVWPTTYLRKSGKVFKSEIKRDWQVFSLGETRECNELCMMGFCCYTASRRPSGVSCKIMEFKLGCSYSSKRIKDLRESIYFFVLIYDPWYYTTPSLMLHYFKSSEISDESNYDLW